MSIYVALTLLLAPDPLNMFLNDHLTSSDPLQSKFLHRISYVALEIYKRARNKLRVLLNLVVTLGKPGEIT